MTTINQTAIEIFHYLRGAVRGAYGVEDFRGKKIVIFGMDEIGQALLSMLPLDNETEIFFADTSLVNYRAAYKICGTIQHLSAGDLGYADIVIDLLHNRLGIERGSVFKIMSLSNIKGNPYTQGIHDFYL